MRVSIYLLLFFFLVAITSCKKKHTVHIKAVNAVTGDPYAGLPYSINGTKTSTNGEKLVFEHNGTLDDNGEAAPNIKVNENLTFNVGVTKPPNNCFQKDIKFFWDAKAKPNPTFQFEYAECAYMNLKMENVNCQGPDDAMEYRDRYSYTEWGNFDYPIFGCFQNLSNDFKAVPAGLRIFNWKVTRAGVTTEYQDSLFLNPGQNGSIYLTY